MKYRASIVVIPIPAEVVESTRRKSEELECKIRSARNRADSILDGLGSHLGLIGEAMVSLYYGLKHVNLGSEIHYHFDVIDERTGTTAEVKSKKRSVVPKPHFFCSVAAANDCQRTDHYIFGSVLCKGDHPHSYAILGSIPGWRLKELRYYGAKGEADPTSGTREVFRFRADCWNIPVFALKPPAPINSVRHSRLTIVSDPMEVSPEGRRLLSMFPRQEEPIRTTT